MANPVDVVIGSEAIKQVQNLVNQLNLADAELLKLSQTALQAGKNISGISTPKGFNDSLANNAKISQDLDKLNSKYNTLHENIVKKAEQSRLAEIRLQQAREKAFDSFEKNAQKEQSIVEKNNNTYNRTQQQINKLTVAYNDLATRKERYNNLSVNEEMRLKTLTAINEKYNNVLKTVDATGGKHFRNVGNYASGYNALGNSINQLTREMPAFANSINTGFMAISNNFAALQDSIKGIIAQNRILAAEGKPTVSVFKQLAGATFSWTTLISIGVTLLTIYGAKLFEMALGLGDVESALKKVDAQQKRYNEGLEQANKNIDHNLILEKNRLKQLGASDTELGKLDKDAARRKLQNFETTRDLLKKELDLEINKVLTKKGISATGFNDEVGLAEKLNAKKIALEKSLGKEIVKFSYLARTDKEKAEVESLAQVNKKISVLETLNNSEIYQRKKEAYAKASNAVFEYGQTVSEINSNINSEGVKLDKASIKAEEDRLKSIAELRKKELELQLANIGERLNNEDIYYTERLSALDEDFLKRVEIAKLDYDEENRLAKGNQDKQKTALINFQLEKLKLLQDYNKKKTELESLDLQAITEFDSSKGKTDIDPFKSVGESANKVVDKLKGFADASDNLKKKIAELNQETKNWLGSFSAEFLQNSGFGSLQTFFDGSFKELLEGSEEDFSLYFNAIAESAQEAFNFISSISQQSFDAERNRLQNQYDVAIGFANGNKAAEEKLATDLEKKKKEIANREAKAKQKQAIFNIAIDTAQAIMSVFAKTPPPAGIPLALFVGALGAVQIGLVAAQKIPQYAEGTDNHTGGLMLVNDAKGASYQEKIIFPNGKEFMPQGRNVLMDAPAGTKVLTPEQQLMQALNGTNINLSKETINRSQGMTAEQMDYVLGKHFGNITTNTTIFDENGMRTWSEKNGNKTIKTASRVTKTGIRV